MAERVEAFRADACGARPPPAAVVIEAPLLFEADTQPRYSATVAVVADDALRMRRIAARDQAELARREARQLPQAEKARRADHVIVNDGGPEELRAQLKALLAAVSR